jgi:hypothetical protein
VFLEYRHQYTCDAPWINEAVLNIGSVDAVWAVPHHRGAGSMERSHLAASFPLPRTRALHQTSPAIER